MKKSTRIHENKNNTSAYEVKRGRGPSNYIVTSPFNWEEDRRFTDESAAHFWAERKNAAICGKRSLAKS